MIEVITMRLRNILVLCALTAMSVGVISCGKKAEEPKAADSTMTAPAPAPAATTTTTTTTTVVDSSKMKDEMKKDEMKKDEMKKK